MALEFLKIEQNISFFEIQEKNGVIVDLLNMHLNVKRSSAAIFEDIDLKFCTRAYQPYLWNIYSGFLKILKISFIFSLEKEVKHRYDRPSDRPRRFAKFVRKFTICGTTCVTT